MVKREKGETNNVRMLTLKQAAQYAGIGVSTCRAWCDKIGATTKFSAKIVRFDKNVIDKALDNFH
jgi:hypothetical protein